MNVDEAMAYTRRDKDQGFWSDDMHNAMVTLATEVERLRAELAAAKAASECPVEVESVYVNPYREVVVSFDESCTAQRFADWVRQIKERGER